MRLHALGRAVVPVALAAGCASLPRGREAVDRVDVETVGPARVDPSDAADRIATAPSPRFLGLWDGVVFEYSLLDRFVLERDLRRVQRFYRARGFYEARVRAGRIERTASDHVRVTVVVEEGPPVLVGEVRLEGLTTLPIDASVAVVRAVRDLRPGRPFDEDDFESAAAAAARALTDRGFAFGRVDHGADVDLVAHRATVTFRIDAGPPSVLGDVSLAGLGKLPEGPVRRALDLRPGTPYSTEEIETARRAVLELGVFGAVTIEPALSEDEKKAAIEAGRPAVVPVRVLVEPAKLHALRIGGGTQLDVIRTEPHVDTGWEDRNFLGGLRRVSIDLRAGLVLFPTRLPRMQKPTHFLPEQKTRAELRQPGFLEPRTGGIVRGEFSIYPVLLAPQVDPGAPILGYREAVGAAGLDRTFFRWMYASAFYGWQTSFPFSYSGVLSPDLRSVHVSYVELTTSWDFRDDAIRPHKGAFISNKLQLAGGALRGDTDDVKVQPELRLFAPISRTVTFSVRGALGFLLPRNYGKTLDEPVPDARDLQLVYFRAFFSGGPSSNRGYPFRGVGPHGPVPFYNPGLAAQELAQQCERGSAMFDPVRCAVPLGGMTLWEASAEVRFPLIGPLTGATFLDGSDVSARRVEIRLDYPHLSTGAGLRYDTPVGPVRLDVGWRLPGLQVPPGKEDPRTQGDPGRIFGAPIAVSLGIGEAF